MLSGEHLVQFLYDGYLVLEPELLTDADHRFFYRRASELYDISHAVDSPTAHLDILGDNIRAQVPEIDRLLTDPAIDGALSAILGPDYLIHPHSYCHRSSGRDQVFHQDGNLPWNERGHCRSHRPEWAILSYYPQDVTRELGPTEVVTGSHYWTVDHERSDGSFHPGDRVDRDIDDAIFTGQDLELRDRSQAEALDRGLGVPDLQRRLLELPAGSAVITHYDLFHRGTRTTGKPPARYMYKFNLLRVHEPEPAAPLVAFPTSVGEIRTTGQRRIQPIVEAQLQWLRGVTAPQTDVRSPGGDHDRDRDHESTAALAKDLGHGREHEKLRAAYLLGRTAAEVHGNASGEIGRNARTALGALEEGLSAESESTRRASSHGLRQSGPLGVLALIRGTDTADPTVRRVAVAGLGTASASENPEAVEVLVRALANDPDDLVRSNAAYSLGHLSRFDTVEPEAIAAVLLDRLAPGVEPDNAFSVGFSRSTVRQSAGYGLSLLLANHRLADESMDRVIDGPLQDDDRYVQGLVVEGLARAEHLSPPARRRMTRYLSARRWNPSPAGRRDSSMAPGDRQYDGDPRGDLGSTLEVENEQHLGAQ